MCHTKHIFLLCHEHSIINKEFTYLFTYCLTVHTVSNTEDKIIFKITGKAVTIIDRDLTLGSSIIPAIDRKDEGEEECQRLIVYCTLYSTKIKRPEIF
jgi:hypothetical protein